MDLRRKLVNNNLLQHSEDDTSRTQGWKFLLEAAKLAAQKGNGDKALIFFEKALATAKRRLGEEHIILGHILAEQAEFHHSRNEPEQAFACYKQVRDILNKETSERHVES
jgi:tetratricopeptide (TPR) repeat protein